jgi:hypothetical protein
MAKTDSESELKAEVERLEREIARLKKAVKSKKFGLVWMGMSIFRGAGRICSIFRSLFCA